MAGNIVSRQALVIRGNDQIAAAKYGGAIASV
jgi:hypothetical protein